MYYSQDAFMRLIHRAYKALLMANVHDTLTVLKDLVDSGPPPRSTVQEAYNILEEDYRKDVSGVASDLVESWRSGEYDGDRDAFYQSIDESVEGTQRVIYTFQAQLGLAFSGNDEAMFEELGESSMEGAEWSKLMFWALRADVIEHLQHQGIDVNDDPPLAGSSLCQTCKEYKPCKNGECEDCRDPDKEDDDEVGEEGAPKR
jgi:hypothetical protein